MNHGLTLKDSSEVDGCARTDSLGVVAPFQETVDTTNGDWQRISKMNETKEGKHVKGMTRRAIRQQLLLTLKTGLGRLGRRLGVRTGFTT